MKGIRVISTAIASATLLASSTLAQVQVDPLITFGQHIFYKTNGSEFFIRGVAYQQDISSNGTTTGNNDFTDPLADAAGCSRDIPILTELQTNMIRVYAVDPTKDHSQCMQMLQNAGIYLLLDLSEPGTSINRDDPEWNDDLYARYTSVVDAFQNYTNVFGYFAGNEVSNNNTNTDASAFVKAAVRDMKAYIKQKNYRTQYVGYATNDDSSIRVNLANYFNCGPAEDSIDFWGYNIYSWCGNSSFTQSGYDVRTQEFSNYSVPAFFAEYGCNTVQPRQFTEVQAIFGDDMTGVWSGGIVYEYFQAANDYGLVSVDGNTASKLSDFTALSSQLAQITPSSTNKASYTPTNTVAQACPTVGADWQASSNLPPIPNAQLCGCMSDALSCIPKASISDDDLGSLFALVCGLDNQACNGISSNATTGNYGAYEMCNPREQLGWALNAYYEQQRQAGNGASACDFSGSATTQAAVSPTGNCAALISQAGSVGTGTVTSAPSGTSKPGSGSAGASGGSSSGSGTSATKKAAAGLVSTPSLDFGTLQLGAYAVCAMVAGAGMILL